MTTHLKADGTEMEVFPANGKTFTLEEMQGYVGGMIEPVRYGRNQTMYVNEEGSLSDLPFNAKATALCKIYIVGDALVMDGTKSISA